MIQTIVYFLICINVVTFLVYGIDKWKAKHGSWRISEATFHSSQKKNLSLHHLRLQ